MPATRTFHLGDVLSVVIERLVAPGHMTAVQGLLEYMAGEPIWTHQLPRVAREAAPALLAQHPQLAKVQAPDFGDDRDLAEQAVEAWLSEQVARYGETLEVAPLSAENHTSIDPLSELGLLGIPKERILPVVVDSSPEEA